MNPYNRVVTEAEFRIAPGSSHGLCCDTVASEPELLPLDIPIIVEDLLRQAHHLADLGAPIESVNAILDHVVALREGRD